MTKKHSILAISQLTSNILYGRVSNKKSLAVLTLSETTKSWQISIPFKPTKWQVTHAQKSDKELVSTFESFRISDFWNHLSSLKSKSSALNSCPSYFQLLLRTISKKKRYIRRGKPSDFFGKAEVKWTKEMNLFTKQIADVVPFSNIVIHGSKIFFASKSTRVVRT